MNGFAKFQLAAAAVMMLGVGGWFAWMKVKPRAPLGGACEAALDCVEGTEYCLSPIEGGAGVCTKQCHVDADCGAALVCKQTSIVESSAVGQHEFVTGYCFAR